MERETAMKILKELHNKSLFAERTALETIIPELKESEDERIRKALVDALNKNLGNGIEKYGTTLNAALTWLEKQGKSSDQIHYWTEEEIEPIISDYLRGVEHYGGMIGRLRCLKPKSLEKQNDCSVKWQKNTPNYKPAINHSVLMKTTQGIAEGEWQGEDWFQYRWSWTLKDSDVLAWMELSNLDEQGEQKPAVVDFNAKDWYVSKVDGKIHDMTYNPTDKVEPKFKVGDVLCDKSCTTLDKNSQPNIEILDIRNGMYICNNCSFPISQQDEYELVAKFDKYEGLTDFERTLANICIGWIGEELGWKQYIKDNADVLLKIAIKKFNSIQDAPFEQKSAAWSDEDEKYFQSLENACAFQFGRGSAITNWLKSLKDRIGG